MKPTHRSIADLIQQVVNHPNAVLMNKHPAAKQLASRGAVVVGPVLRAMRGRTPPGQHPRDVAEALGAVLSEMARRDPAPLIDILERNAAPHDPQLMFVVWALADAPKGRALPPLLRALRHSEPLIRWSAAEALIALRSKKAIPALVEALRDRSSAVKGTIVHALHHSKFFCTPAAIEPLRRMVANKRLKREVPGTWHMAAQLLKQMKPKASGNV